MFVKRFLSAVWSNAEELNFLLISLTCVSWNLHNDASGIDDRQSIHTTSRRVQSSMQSSASWKARQAGRIPLLAATHGATLSRCDMQIAQLLVALDIAAGGGILIKFGYLWGMLQHIFCVSQNYFVAQTYMFTEI